MSISLMSSIWKKEKLTKGSERLVLLALADCTNDNGGICWPSLDYIAMKSNISRRFVIVLINKLEERGYLEKIIRPNKSNIYRIIPTWDKELHSGPEVNPSSLPEVNPSSLPEVNPSSLKSLINHNKTPIINASKNDASAPTIHEPKNGKIAHTLSEEEMETVAQPSPREPTQRKEKIDTASPAPTKHPDPTLSWLRSRPIDLRGLFAAFLETAGKMYLPNNYKEAKIVYGSVGDWYKMNATPDDIRLIIREMRNKGLTIKNTNSITGMLRDMLANRVAVRTSVVNVEELEKE